jgi:hypothetical protein
VLRELEQLVGRPEEPGTARLPGQLTTALTEEADSLVGHLGRKLSRILVALIEEPAYRLAGAEEAIRQMIPLLENVLQHHESLGHELTTRSAEAHKRLRLLLEPAQLGAANGRLPSVTLDDLLELLRSYPKWRYQSLILEQLARSYVSLRGSLSDQLREINFCRARLGELQRIFQANQDRAGLSGRTETTASAPAASMVEPGSGRTLFPGGCRSMPEAAERLLEAVTAGDLQALDEKVQSVIAQELTALVHVCMASSNLLRNLEGLMLRQVEGFIEERLKGIDPAQLFLEQYPEIRDGITAVTTSFEEAVPRMAEGLASGRSEVCVLATPNGEAGERFREHADEALGDVQLASVGNSEDIVFYREVPDFSLADLEQLGPLGYEAYRQMTGVQHFTPHCRTDITEWRAANTRASFDPDEETPTPKEPVVSCQVSAVSCRGTGTRRASLEDAIPLSPDCSDGVSSILP